MLAVLCSIKYFLQNSLVTWPDHLAFTEGTQTSINRRLFLFSQEFVFFVLKTIFPLLSLASRLPQNNYRWSPNCDNFLSYLRCIKSGVIFLSHNEWEWGMREEGRLTKEITRKPLCQFVTFLSSVFCSAFHLGVFYPHTAGYISGLSWQWKLRTELWEDNQQTLSSVPLFFIIKVRAVL